MTDNISNKSDKHINIKLLILLTIFLAIVFILTLNSRQLISGDETRVAGISAQTAIYGNWVKPELNGKDFLEKPPLFFWADAISMKIFGYNPFGARLPAALMAIFGALGVFIFMRKIKYSNIAAFSAAIILATSAQYWEYGHKSMIDMMLAAFIGVSILAFKAYCDADSTKEKLLYFCIYSLALAGGLMSKGLVGIAIPIASIGSYLFFTHVLLKKPEKWTTWLIFFSGVILSFIPFAIWIMILYKQAGYDAVYTVVWTNNFGRFTGTHAEHVEPFYYYLLKILGQLAPWTFLLPFALWFHFKQAFKKKNQTSLFLLCSLIVPYTMLSMAAGKRQVYILPLYAFEAILIGATIAYFYEWNKAIGDKFKLSILLKYLKILFPILFAITGIVCIVFSFIKHLDINWLFVPILLIISSIFSLILILKEKKWAMPALLITFALLFSSIDSVFIKNAKQKYSYVKLFSYVKSIKKQGQPIVLLQAHERLRGASVFYLKETVPEQNIKELQATIKSNKNLYLYNGGKKLILPEKMKFLKIVKSFKVGKKYQMILKLKE